MQDVLSKRALPGADPYEPTEEDLRLIAGFSPMPVTAADVTVRSMVLCTGDYDRDRERFSDEVLEQFARTLVGKALLIGHRHDSAPEGLFYRAEVVRRPNASPAVRAWAYLPRTPANEHVRTLMDTGVLRYVSIGFRCEKLLCDECGSDLFTYDCGHVRGGRLGTASWAGEAEAVEGSLVYLGSQYEAVLLKGLAAGASVDDVLEEQLTEALAALEAREREIAELRPLADDGLRQRKELAHELHALTCLGGEGEAWTALEPAVARMSTAELRALCDATARKVDWLAPPRPWTAPRTRGREPDLSAYAIPAISQQ